MKKPWKLILIVVSISLILCFGCAEKEDKSNNEEVEVTEDKLLGLWRRTDAGETSKGREVLDDGSGFFGTYDDSDSFVRGGEFTWSLTNNVMSFYFIVSENEFDEEITFLSSTELTTLRDGEDSVRNFEKDEN